jgi:hypothetical protein
MGSGADSAALIWPSGYTAQGSPLSIYDAHGARVAVVGTQVTIGGGLAPDEPQVSVLGCTGFQRAWIVGDVVRA